MFTPAYLKFVATILQQTIFIFLLLGSVFAFVAGLLLIFRADAAFRVADRLNRWISTRAALRALEEQHSIAKPLYRLHRLVGLLICAGALYAMVRLGTPRGEIAVSKTLSGIGSKQFAAWISDSLRIVLLAGNFGACLFGLVFTVRPSALRRLEAWADRRISARKATKPLEEVRMSTDRFTRAYPRLVGSVVTAGSLYVMVNLCFVVFAGK